MKLWHLAVLAVSLSAPVAHAADPLESSLDICSSCHGAAGKPSDPTIPIIFGQQARYLEKQLKDYRSGDRDSQIMSSMAEAVPFKDIARAADVLAARPWPSREKQPTSQPATAAACMTCHGTHFEGGQSPEGIAPRLSGQFSDYLNDQMAAFARGARENQPAMTAMMKALTDQERKDLAFYLGNL